MTDSIKKVKQFYSKYPGHLKTASKEIAERLDVSVSDVFEGRNEYRKSNKDNSGTYNEYDEKENHENDNVNRGYDTPTAMQDQTLEEYCVSIGLNPEKVDKYNDVKYWTDASGNRRYSIVPKKIEEEDFKEDLIDAIKEYTSKAIPVEGPNTVMPCSAVINVYDAHFDKLSQIGEGYTIEDNINLIRTAFSSLLYGIKEYKPEVIYLPIGNDFFDTNDFRSTTKKGTPQALSVHWKESFQLGVSLLRDLIDEASRYTEEVIVVPVEGNHDEDKVFYLNEVMKAAYSNCDRIKLEKTSSPRFYYKYGVNMLGFGHGNIEKRKLNKLSGIVPMEAPEIWGSTKYRELFLGDIHTNQEYRFNRTSDKEGLTVRFLRDIGLTHSTWDRQEAYHKGRKSIEAFIIDIDQGITSNLIYNV